MKSLKLPCKLAGYYKKTYHHRSEWNLIEGTSKMWTSNFHHRHKLKGMLFNRPRMLLKHRNKFSQSAENRNPIKHKRQNTFCDFHSRTRPKPVHTIMHNNLLPSAQYLVICQQDFLSFSHTLWVYYIILSLTELVFVDSIIRCGMQRRTKLNAT